MLENVVSWPARSSGSSVGSGPGVVLPKHRLLGFEAGHAGLQSRPRLPSRARMLAWRRGAADGRCASLIRRFRRAQCFALRLAFGESCGRRTRGRRVSAKRIWVTAAMWIAWFSWRFPRREPADGHGHRTHLDWCGAGVRSEVIAVGEPGDVAGVSDDHRGDDGPTPKISVSVVSTRTRLRAASSMRASGRQSDAGRRDARTRGRDGRARPGRRA